MKYIINKDEMKIFATFIRQRINVPKVLTNSYNFGSIKKRKAQLKKQTKDMMSNQFILEEIRIAIK